MKGSAMPFEVFIILSLFVAILGCVIGMNACDRPSVKRLIISLLIIAAGISSAIFAAIPPKPRYANDGKEITIFECASTQWGIIPEEPKRAVNLNEEFGQIISKDQSVVIRGGIKLYKGFLYYNVKPKLQIIEIPKRPGGLG